jgi:hypothetical protein
VQEVLEQKIRGLLDHLSVALIVRKDLADARHSPKRLLDKSGYVSISRPLDQEDPYQTISMLINVRVVLDYPNQVSFEVSTRGQSASGELSDISVDGGED